MLSPDAVGRIHKLSDELANQIAAGEVVERPASVAKELVENALDAGATRVVVDIEHGGSGLVRVSDDGHGMSAEDAVLSLERHATSKITAVDDLFRLGTFGFRGEALPSIASVSRLILRTRARDADEACEVEVLGGKPPVVRPAGAAVGTTIEVRDLFFNVPARRKFLKATATESAHIGEVLRGASLARPDVTFALTRDGRNVREHLRVGSRSERARDVLSGEKLVSVVSERGAVRIEAMLAPPERAGAGASGLSLLVNGRPVRDRLLARAVANAYGSVLESGRYPVGVVWLDLPTELVDINVHPQKAEVRFTDARGIFDAITRELNDALGQAFGLPEPAQPFVREQFSPPAVLPVSQPSSRGTFGYKKSDREPFARLFEQSTAGTSRPPPPTGADKASLFDPHEASLSGFFVASAKSEAPPPDARTDDAPPPPTKTPFAGPSLYARLQFVGQVRRMYLVCEGDDGVYVLDQHAAAERVTFDRLRRAFSAREVETQRLLVPEVIELGTTSVAALEEFAEDVKRLGIEVRAVGDSAVAVHAVPALLRAADPSRLVHDLVGEVSRSGARAFSGAIDLALATMACHGSLRAGDPVTHDEACALLQALDEVDFAGHCPHGRPVVTSLSFSELERRVGR